MLGVPVRYLLKHPLTGIVDIAADPVEVLMTMQDYYVDERERRGPRWLYESNPDWESRLHERLSVPFPCETGAEFAHLWAVVVRELAGHGIDAGPETYKWWNDGDAGLVRAIWCLIRHLKPRSIVETGVGHGMTSRFILEALKENGAGHLWSIDLPPLERELHAEIGVAVGKGHEDRWTLIRGSSRRRLPRLLATVQGIDMFIHDSMHSERNVRFELDHIWPVLPPGGIVVVDDVDANSGFHTFIDRFSIQHALVCDAEPLRPDNRRINHKGQFGIIIK